jgi:acyl-coenzyme A thioesterase PaaI-like protein
MSKAFQDHYPSDVAQCYGCGRLNELGHQIKSRWDGDETLCTFQPKPYHTAIPGYVYGGLIASLIDCHGTGSASAAAHRDRGGKEGEELPRFVTASLHVNYHKPTPLGPPLEIRGRIKEVKGRKVVVEAELLAEGDVCASGEIVCVEMPEGMLGGSD